MIRSIFPILKINFKNFLVSFIFASFMYLFGFFHLNVLFCEDQLIKTAVNGITVRYSPSISPFRLYNSISFLQYYILNTPGTEYKFNIFRYLQQNGLRFNRTHPCDHYHLNLYLDNIFNVHYGYSFTHYPEKLNLLLEEFSKFSELDLFKKQQYQFILNDLKVYDLNVLKVDDNSFKFKQFLLQHNENCILHFKRFIK